MSCHNKWRIKSVGRMVTADYREVLAGPKMTEWTDVRYNFGVKKRIVATKCFKAPEWTNVPYNFGVKKCIVATKCFETTEWADVPYNIGVKKRIVATKCFKAPDCLEHGSSRSKVLTREI